MNEWENFNWPNMCVTEVLAKQIDRKIFEELMKKCQIYEGHELIGLRSSINSRYKEKYITAYQNRCLKTSDKEKIIKAARGEKLHFIKISKDESGS